MFVLDLSDKVQKREREIRDIRAVFVQARGLHNTHADGIKIF
jgi:hypothetical protein